MNESGREELSTAAEQPHVFMWLSSIADYDACRWLFDKK